MTNNPRYFLRYPAGILILSIAIISTAAAAPAPTTPSALLLVNCDHPVNPTVHFSKTYSPSDTVAQTVAFTDESTTSASQPVTTYLWDFGDGTTSTQKNPRHTYTSYTVSDAVWVKLKVTTACGRSGEFNAGFGLFCNPPVASFTTEVTEGAAPLTVHITDTSAHAPESSTTWKYTIWQSHTELAQLNQRNPVYTFGSPGTYRIYQNLTKSCSANSVAVQDITVHEPAAAATVVTTTGEPSVTATEVSPEPTTAASGTPEVPAAPSIAMETSGVYPASVPAAGGTDAPRQNVPTASPQGRGTDSGSSTGFIIAGVIVLALIGAGAYLYLKKKSP